MYRELRAKICSEVTEQEQKRDRRREYVFHHLHKTQEIVSANIEITNLTNLDIPLEVAHVLKFGLQNLTVVKLNHMFFLQHSIIYFHIGKCMPKRKALANFKY